MIEAAVALHQPVQGRLAGVPKSRMPQIMRQADRLGQILVRAECARQRAADLRHLHRMREPVPIVIPFMVDENLCLVFEAAERGGVNDAVAIPLERGAIRMLFLAVCAAATITAGHGI